MGAQKKEIRIVILLTKIWEFVLYLLISTTVCVKIGNGDLGFL